MTGKGVAVTAKPVTSSNDSTNGKIEMCVSLERSKKFTLVVAVGDTSHDEKMSQSGGCTSGH
jgi:hypothetical protein